LVAVAAVGVEVAVEVGVEPDSADDLDPSHHRDELALDLHPDYYWAFGGNTSSSSLNSRFCPGGVKT
jgi:hypothetical protein